MSSAAWIRTRRQQEGCAAADEENMRAEMFQETAGLDAAAFGGMEYVSL